MNFSQALELLKDGKGVSRREWANGQFIRLQIPDANSKMNLPYVYMTIAEYIYPYFLDGDDILSEDWMEVMS